MPFFVSVAYAMKRSSSEIATSVASGIVVTLARWRSFTNRRAPVSFVLSALGAGDGDGEDGGDALAPGDGEVCAAICGDGSPLGGALGLAFATGDALAADAGDPLGAGEGSSRYAIVAPPFFATT